MKGSRNQLNVPHTKMFLEPPMLVFAFFLFFLLSVIYVRMDFSITVDKGAEAKVKVAG